MQAVHLFAEKSHLKKLIRQDLFPSDKAQEGTVKGLAPAGCQAPCLEVNVKLRAQQGSDVSLSPRALGSGSGTWGSATDVFTGREMDQLTALVSPGVKERDSSQAVKRMRSPPLSGIV